MEIENLHLSQLAGFNFNLEEKVLLSSSLVTLKQDYKLAKVLVWGKILGTQRDYLLAEGYKNPSNEQEKIIFFSVDAGSSWGQLQEPSEQDLKRAQGIHKRFSGDPSIVDVLQHQQHESEDKNAGLFTEEKRLAATVRLINYEAVSVPRDSFYRDHLGKLQRNTMFEGIGYENATSLKEYIHLSDFASLDKDEPSEGCWSLKRDQTGIYAILQSLIWPGYAAIHFNGTTAWFYIGTGQKNHDIGFML